MSDSKPREVEIRFRLEFDADAVTQARAVELVETYMKQGLDNGIVNGPYEDMGTIGASGFWTDEDDQQKGLDRQ